MSPNQIRLHYQYMTQGISKADTEFNMSQNQIATIIEKEIAKLQF